MTAAAAIVLGFLLDALLGDPLWMPHPVVLMGRGITALEKWLRRCFPKTARGELTAGLILTLVLTIGTWILTSALSLAAGKIHPVLGFALQTLWSWQVLAAKGLWQESMNVHDRLKEGDLPGARTAVSRIVGRDTAALSGEGVAKAAVETVAENLSDGVIAPLFYLLLGGAPLAMTYKAVNTMDSMVGYKNEKYLYFGRCAARLDDLVNLIPARISALLLLAAGFFLGEDVKEGARIWRRDRRKHASPNSAQTESVCAGLLRIRLAGDASYFGTIYRKPFIGDQQDEVTWSHIHRADRLMYAASLIGLFLVVLIRWGVTLWL